MKERFTGEIMEKSTVPKINKLVTFLSIEHSNPLLATVSTSNSGLGYMID